MEEDGRRTMSPAYTINTLEAFGSGEHTNAANIFVSSTHIRVIKTFQKIIFGNKYWKWITLKSLNNKNDLKVEQTTYYRRIHTSLKMLYLAHIIVILVKCAIQSLQKCRLKLINTFSPANMRKKDECFVTNTLKVHYGLQICFYGYAMK